MSSSGRAKAATVVEALPAEAYRLEMDNREQVVGHLAAPGERNFVRLRLRDRVLVEISADDPKRGRIVRVLK